MTKKAKETRSLGQLIDDQIGALKESIRLATQIVQNQEAIIEDRMARTHVVATRYVSPATGSVVKHAYGPFTRGKAEGERRRILRDHAEGGYAPDGDIEVNVLRVLDLEAINAAALAGQGGSA